MNRWPINFRRVAAIAGILILVLMVMDFNARLEELNRLNRQAAVVRAQATQEMQTQIALQTQVAYAGSDQAVEDYARSEGHMIQDGDQPVVPVGQPGSEPLVAATPTVVPTPMPNWRVWWELFFGER